MCPVIRGAIRAADGSWVRAPFLADTAADRTVFSVDSLRALGLPPVQDTDHLEGLGGRADSIVLATQIQMTRETGEPVLFKGRFAAVTDPVALDMSVLGRDITNLFALIVDRPQDVVCLLGQGHRYLIVPS